MANSVPFNLIQIYVIMYLEAREACWCHTDRIGHALDQPVGWSNVLICILYIETRGKRSLESS